SKKKPVTYCGYETSGEIHLGHLVTLTKLLDMEKAGFHVKILLADWHAWVNKKGSWDELKKFTEMNKKAMSKLGFKDPEFVVGTSFQRTAEYFDDILTMALHTSLNRALRSMQETARDIDNATVSQMVYPLMQIADIKHLKVDVAEAGIDQRKIHMLSREILEQVNYKKPALVHTPIITALTGPGTKMSSSAPNSMISVRDSAETIKAKISKAYCPEADAKENPILQITQLIVFPRIESFDVKRPEKFGGNASFANYAELEKAFVEKKLHPMDLKSALTGYLAEILEPVAKAFL
ncbi:MAG: tyrosine--tRNA ligase, partial [Candidatus Diapherotrites archaeon]|nr:tyrosine--tRNA ligase [Candidatus Diapherotrites archaeon]